MVQRQRRDGWGELERGDGQYDPSPRQPDWSSGQGGAGYDPSPGGSPGGYPQYPENPSYHFAPPPAAYGGYPPPYAYPYPPYGYPYPSPPNPTLPVVGGILVIVGCVITSVLFLMFAEPIWWAIGDTLACFVMFVIFIIFGIIGGICAMMRRLLPMAVVGAVLAMIAGLFMVIGFVLSLVGLVLIAIAHQTFTPTGGPPPRMY